MEGGSGSRGGREGTYLHKIVVVAVDVGEVVEGIRQLSGRARRLRLLHAGQGQGLFLRQQGRSLLLRKTHDTLHWGLALL